ncbi:MAG: hypothetical protein GXP45_05950 [bacterium]|nr:hypothetical protein [bacterium]
MFMSLFQKINTKCCRCVFVLSLVVSYFLVQQNLWVGWFAVLGVLFMLSFAFTITCLVRNIKERTKEARIYKKSWLGVVSVAIGIGALQVCGVNALFCGSSIGLSLLSVIFPVSFVHELSAYAIWIIIASILAQRLGLYRMKCFVKKA